MGFVNARNIPDEKDIVIMQSLIDGKTIKQAESAAGLSSSSVTRRMEMMKDKFSAENTYQLIAILTDRKYITPKKP